MNKQGGSSVELYPTKDKDKHSRIGGIILDAAVSLTRKPSPHMQEHSE